MKSVDAKKIAVATAGALLLGASMLAAAPITYGNTDIINANGKPVVKVVVGANAKASDGVAAANIAAVIGSLAYGSQTVSAVLSGEPACTVTGGTGAGTCPVTNAKATLEIEVPGTVEVAGAYDFRTYIYGFIDTDVETEDDQAYSTTPLTVDEDMWADALAEYDFSISGVSGDVTEDQVVTVLQKSDAPEFSTTDEKWYVKLDSIGYDITFDQTDYEGVPVCTDKATMEVADSADNCSDDDLTSVQRATIKFLGQSWVISDMVPGDSIKLAKESVPKQIVHAGESLTVGKYAVYLMDVTLPEYGNFAIVKVVNTETNATVKQVNIEQGDTETIDLPDGTEMSVHAYKVVPGLLAERYAELAIFSEEITLEDGESIDEDLNEDWLVDLTWDSYGGGDDDVLTEIAIERTDFPTKILEGDSINLIEDPVLTQFYFSGMTLTDANYDTLEVSLAEDKTYYVNDGEDAAEGDYDLVVLDSEMKAFNVGDEYDQIAFGVDNGPLMFYEDNKWKAVEDTSTTVTQFLSSTNVSRTNVSIWNGTSCVLYNSTDLDYVNVSMLYDSTTYGDADVDYYFNVTGALPATDTTELYKVVARNVSGTATWDYALDNGTRVCVIEADDIDDMTHQVSYLDILYEINGDSDLDESIIYNRSIAGTSPAQGRLTIEEDADADAAGAQMIYTHAYIDATNTELESSGGDEDELDFTDVGAPSTLNGEEPLFITQKGSKFTAKTDDSATLKMAKKVGELQYYLKPVGAEVEAGVVTYEFGIGDSRVVSGLTIELTDITDVGACSVTGAGCTASMGTVAAKLDTGEASKAVSVPYKFAATDRLVVLDSEAPTAEKLILVGGPIVNTVTASTLAGTDVKIDTPGVKVKQEVGNNIVVAGYTAADTTAAAAEFIAELLAKA